NGPPAPAAGGIPQGLPDWRLPECTNPLSLVERVGLKGFHRLLMVQPLARPFEPTSSQGRGNDCVAERWPREFWDLRPSTECELAISMALLTVQGLTKTFGGFTAIKDVSFEVAEGEILGLIGPNGSGKSTTFNCIAGMYVPTAGSIVFDGREIAGLPANRVCHAGIGRTYQIPRPFRNLTILENVALSAWFGQNRSVSRDECWRLAAEALEMVGLPTDPKIGRASCREREWLWGAGRRAIK